MGLRNDVTKRFLDLLRLQSERCHRFMAQWGRRERTQEEGWLQCCWISWQLSGLCQLRRAARHPLLSDQSLNVTMLHGPHDQELTQRHSKCIQCYKGSVPSLQTFSLEIRLSSKCVQRLARKTSRETKVDQQPPTTVPGDMTARLLIKQRGCNSSWSHKLTSVMSKLKFAHWASSTLASQWKH